MGKGATRGEDIAALTLGESLSPDASGWPAPGGRVLFLHARAAAVRQARDSHGWACVQPLRPLADELEAWGCSVAAEPADADRGGYDAVLALPPRQRDLARACLARAVASLREGGQLRMAMANLEGARSGERDLGDLIGTVQSQSRHKCRMFGGVLDTDRIDRGLLEAWLALDAPREILDGRFVSRPGLFAWDRIDTASALLARHLPSDLRGSLGDLGAGFGYLASQALQRNPGLDTVHLYEADARALEPARENIRRTLEALGRDVACDVHWHDVTKGVARRHDVIVCNPPFHAGRADRPQLGQSFIEAAAGALGERGQLWLVANRHLPYEATLGRLFPDVHTVIEQDGFKVIHAVRGKAEA